MRRTIKPDMRSPSFSSIDNASHGSLSSFSGILVKPGIKIKARNLHIRFTGIGSIDKQDSSGEPLIPMESKSDITSKDEFEEIEVAEFDVNVLWKLLHDEPTGEEEAGRDHDGAVPKQTAEVTDSNLNSGIESYWCLNNNDNIADFNWFHVMEETSIPCNEIGGWYEEPCMEMDEILEIGDYTFSHTTIFSDEIGYIGLWQ
ncbi:hypothetical protein SASPL_132333 [Salvia splendens]|uniref:Uncharacterized protein n=1 Tax=Salvia splendens TaxID=180675 RepID=A0A8X8ZH03_SALSN|nr:hypothetical protein SASPL_132333 [Salvia splendens]